jgi:cyclophilin family peptidyl-prolyl cis-trans isomerase
MGMKRFAFLSLALIAASPPPPETPVPSPNEIVAAAKSQEWVAIAASDLLVMDLAADRDGKARRVVIQLMPAPVSQGWVGNIRKLAAAKWWDGTSVNRVQDNYVVQWGDATEKKALPENLASVPEGDYTTAFQTGMFQMIWGIDGRKKFPYPLYIEPIRPGEEMAPSFSDTYSFDMGFAGSFPVGIETKYSDHKSAKKIQVSPDALWPVHCYGMVGVGRNMPPDTGTGAELYTVIGHAPRHLDRNIALVGRVIQGIEHLSSLPRGTGALGFYETAEERVPILSVRLGTDVSDLPQFEYLSTESESFTRYADARANRRDAFFIKPAGGADICNIPVPVRRLGK